MKLYIEGYEATTDEVDAAIRRFIANDPYHQYIDDDAYFIRGCYANLRDEGYIDLGGVCIERVEG